MREETIRRMLVIGGAALLVVFALTPFTWMLWVSVVRHPDFLYTGNPGYTIQNYVNVLTSEPLHFLDQFRNSFVISAITALIVTISASLAAYAISRLRFPGRKAVPVFVLAMSMFPPIAIVGYLYRVFAQMGLLNTYLALILPYIAITVPLALWINLSYFDQIPVDLDRAALVDGAGRFKILFRIIMPLALPGIFSSFLLVFIASFNEFLLAIMLTIDYRAQTLPVGIAQFEGLHGEIPWGNVMAASALASVPLVGLTLIFQKYIIQGLMGGALKG